MEVELKPQPQEKRVGDLGLFGPRRERASGDLTAACLEDLHSGARWGDEAQRLAREQQGLPPRKGKVSWEVRVAPAQAMSSPVGHSPTGSGHSGQSQALPTGTTDSHSAG